MGTITTQEQTTEKKTLLLRISRIFAIISFAILFGIICLICSVTDSNKKGTKSIQAQPSILRAYVITHCYLKVYMRDKYKKDRIPVSVISENGMPGTMSPSDPAFAKSLGIGIFYIEGYVNVFLESGFSDYYFYMCKLKYKSGESWSYKNWDLLELKTKKVNMDAYYDNLRDAITEQ